MLLHVTKQLFAPKFFEKVL